MRPGRILDVSWLTHVSPPGLQGGAAFFSALREGDLVTFSCEDEADRTLWLQALYRATGQAYKPVPPPQDRLAQDPALNTSTFSCILSVYLC